MGIVHFIQFIVALSNCSSLDSIQRHEALRRFFDKHKEDRTKIRAHLVKVNLRRTGHVAARVDRNVHLLPRGSVHGRVRPLLWEVVQVIPKINWQKKKKCCNCISAGLEKPIMFPKNGHYSDEPIPAQPSRRGKPSPPP